MSASRYRTISDALFDLDEEGFLGGCRALLAAGAPAPEIIDHGITPGMRRIGAAFESGDMILSHMVIGADLMKEAIAILEPALVGGAGGGERRAKVVIGTVQGDIHDIGKGILAVLLLADGFEVIDLGRDVPNEQFVETVAATGAEFLCMSALMTTSVGNQERVIGLLERAGLRERVTVMCGGSAMTRPLAESIGGDGYGESAVEGVAVMKSLLVKRRADG